MVSLDLVAVYVEAVATRCELFNDAGPSTLFGA
jgi:hypothetical protein